MFEIPERFIHESSKSFQNHWTHCGTKFSPWNEKRHFLVKKILMDLVALGAGDFFDKQLERLWENCCEW